MVTIRATLPALAVAILLAGCANKQEQSPSAQQPSATAQPTGQPAAAPQGHEEGQSEQVSTEGSAADIMQRAHNEEKQLAEIITSAQLKDVHKKAFAVRDLVVAAAGKAGNLSSAPKSGIDQHVKEVSSLASELDEAGDSGNLAKTKSLHAQLQIELRMIDQLLGASSH